MQAKAANETGLLHEALEKYPHIQVAATDEVAGQIADQRVFPSGFDNQELQNRVVQPMEDVWDGPIEDLVEHVLPGLPFVLIATTEGTRALLGRQAFRDAFERSTQRGLKTGAGMGVGAAMALLGAGVFSLPATFLHSSA